MPAPRRRPVIHDDLDILSFAFLFGLVAVVILGGAVLLRSCVAILE
jgi:hypothetical protein